MTTIDRNLAEAYRRYFSRYAVGYNRYADGGGNSPKHDKNYNTVLTPEQEVQFQQWLKTMPVNLKSDYDYDLRGAWLAGVNPDEYLHMPDKYKKPWHPTFSDESIYSSPHMQGGHWNGENFTTSPYNKYMQGFKYGNWGANSFGGGGGIHIKKENRGKFSEAAKRAGYSTQAYARHIMANKENYSPTLVKRANFARNAASWHGYGGYVFADGGKPDDPPVIKPVNLLGDMNVPLTRSQGNVMAADKTAAVPVAQSKPVIKYKQAEEKAAQTMQNVADIDAQRQGYANAEDKANQEMIAASLARIEAERGEIKPYDGVITDKDRTPNSGMFAASTPQENRRTMANLGFTAGLLTPGLGQLATPYFMASGLKGYYNAGKNRNTNNSLFNSFANYASSPSGIEDLMDISLWPVSRYTKNKIKYRNQEGKPASGIHYNNNFTFKPSAVLNNIKAYQQTIKPIDIAAATGEISAYSLPAVSTYMLMNNDDVKKRLQGDLSNNEYSLAVGANAISASFMPYIISKKLGYRGKIITPFINKKATSKLMTDANRYISNIHEGASSGLIGFSKDIIPTNYKYVGKNKTGENFAMRSNLKNRSIEISNEGLSQRPTRYKQTMGHEVDHFFQPFHLDGPTTYFNPIAEYYLAEPNHRLYKNGLDVFDKNNTPPWIQSNWNASPDEFMSEVNGWKFALGYEKPYILLDKNSKSKLDELLYREIGRNFNFKKKEIKKLLDTLGEEGRL